MRVCFVCPNILPLFGIPADGGFGGAEIQIRQIARYLVAQGAEVDILVSTELGPKPRTVEGFRLVPAIEDRTRSRFVSGTAKLTLLNALRRSHADVYVSTCAAPDVALISSYAHLMRKPFVYRVAHDTECDGTFERRQGWRGRLFGMGLRSANVVVAQHQDQAGHLEARGIRAPVIRNSFEIGSDDDPPERDIDALWVGRSEPWKRPSLVLEMARTLPHRRFTMVCALKRGQEQHFENLRAGAAKLPNVAFVGGVPFAETQSYFDRARIFLGTSEEEGFPNTYIQACIAGTPIASLEVDPESFIETNGCGFVARGNLGKLTDGVERLLSNAGEWRSCSESARAYARRMHNVEIEGAKWADLLGSLQRAAHR